VVYLDDSAQPWATAAVPTGLSRVWGKAFWRGAAGSSEQFDAHGASVCEAGVFVGCGCGGICVWEQLAALASVFAWACWGLFGWASLSA